MFVSGYKKTFGISCYFSPREKDNAISLKEIFLSIYVLVYLPNINMLYTF